MFGLGMFFMDYCTKAMGWTDWKDDPISDKDTLLGYYVTCDDGSILYACQPKG